MIFDKLTNIVISIPFQIIPPNSLSVKLYAKKTFSFSTTILYRETKIRLYLWALEYTYYGAYFFSSLYA